MSDPEELAVSFGRLLRGTGLDVPVGSVITFTAALAAVGMDDRQAVYWAGRATLVRRPEDIGPYDDAFAAFWLGRGAPLTTDTRTESITLAVDDDSEESGEGDGPEAHEGEVLTVRYSAHEILHDKDFAAYTQAEFAEARRLMTDLRLVGALRRSRRREPTRARRGRPTSAARCGGRCEPEASRCGPPT